MTEGKTMARTITWGELITIVLFLLGAALLFYLVLAIANLVRLLRNANDMVDRIKPNLEKTMANLPAISENAAKITNLLNDNMENLTKVMQNVGKISDSARTAADTIQRDVIVKAKGLLDVADGVRRYFVKKHDAKSHPSVKSGSAVYRYTYRKEHENPDEVVVVKSADEAADKAESISPDKTMYQAQGTAAKPAEQAQTTAAQKPAEQEGMAAQHASSKTAEKGS
jgi:hypothetical protein